MRIAKCCKEKKTLQTKNERIFNEFTSATESNFWRKDENIIETSSKTTPAIKQNQKSL